MKHQITLVGSQLLPVYVGIKEFNPDKVSFIVSSESRAKICLLKAFLHGRSYSEWSCDAYDFDSIKNTCEKILDNLSPEDEVSFNLTGGTKLMMLAAHSVMHVRKKKGFYINQDDSFLEFPTFERRQIECELTIKEFFDLSGHLLYSAKTLSDYDDRDLLMANVIDTFVSNENRKYTSITSYIRKKYLGNQSIPPKGNATMENGIDLFWDVSKVQASQNGKKILDLKSNHINDLFFNAVWWEILVAAEISKWVKAKELLLKCELPFKTDKETKKNEIDILVNLGKKLIFVECKSGLVKQEDVNKMRVIKQTYGGVISKSLLVSRYLPSTTILEKCKELDIEVFYCYAFNRQVSPISKLITKLNDLEKRLFV